MIYLQDRSMKKESEKKKKIGNGRGIFFPIDSNDVHWRERITLEGLGGIPRIESELKDVFDDDHRFGVGQHGDPIVSRRSRRKHCPQKDRERKRHRQKRTRTQMIDHHRRITNEFRTRHREIEQRIEQTIQTRTFTRINRMRQRSTGTTPKHFNHHKSHRAKRRTECLRRWSPPQQLR